LLAIDLGEGDDLNLLCLMILLHMLHDRQKYH